MTGFEILNIYEALGSMINNEFDLNTSFVIAKDMQELDVCRNIIDTKRNKLIEKYAEKDENDNIVKITNPEEFNKEIDELLNEEVEINLTKINKESLSDVKISPKNATWLMHIIE